VFPKNVATTMRRLKSLLEKAQPMGRRLETNLI
jgi:hypothetical protein